MWLGIGGVDLGISVAQSPRSGRRTTMRRSALIAALLILAAVVIAQKGDAAQNFRYYGSATAIALAADPLIADVGAGGRDEDGDVIITKDCDARQRLCFDETATAGVIPDLLITGTARTFGGAQTETGQQNDGFPRVVSTAQASVVLIPDILSVAIAPTSAIADSFTGELSAVGGPVVIQLAGVDITLPVGDGIELPGLFTLLPMSSSQTTRDGLAIIRVDGAILVPDPIGPLEPLGPVILGHAEAGIEQPFTEGGGGGGSCSLSPSTSTRSSGGWQLLFVIGLLGWIALRRSARP